MKGVIVGNREYVLPEMGDLEGRNPERGGEELIMAKPLICGGDALIESSEPAKELGGVPYAKDAAHASPSSSSVRSSQKRRLLAVFV